MENDCLTKRVRDAKHDTHRPLKRWKEYCTSGSQEAVKQATGLMKVEEEI